MFEQKLEVGKCLNKNWKLEKFEEKWQESASVETLKHMEIS